MHLRIIETAASVRLPAIFQWPEYVAEGAFAAYGPRLLPIFRRIGQQMVEVLKRAKPADIPIEQPAKVELVINLKTAQELGVTVPQTLLARADAGRSQNDLDPVGGRACVRRNGRATMALVARVPQPRHVQGHRRNLIESRAGVDVVGPVARFHGGIVLPFSRSPTCA